MSDLKRIAAINDLSCVGKCSLTVALPVLSAMGISCSVLPTAVLSTHTAFPNPHIRPLTEDIVPIAEHLQQVLQEQLRVRVLPVRLLRRMRTEQST